jgi:NAD(P)-dependent dehydrogenase (short-subunit alcohol dehydrogenase family)
MIGLSHSLAVELAPHGIRVNCVCPGATEGERLERVIRERAEAEGISLEESRRFFIGPTPLGRTVTADEVARAVLYFADAEASSGVVGQALNVDGGFRMQ